MTVLFPYEAVLFDFDGLLVNTEPLHYAAYMRMSQDHGWQLHWDFAKFCHEAHSRAGGFFEALEKQIQQKVDRGSLYKEKTRWYEKMLQEDPVELMPGVQEVLEQLQQHGHKRAVVTNSPRLQIQLLQAKIPLLKTIPLWITREDYGQPKPHPEGYLVAVEKLGVQNKKAIGFEDTVKGIQALLAAGVKAVLISPPDYRGREESQKLGATIGDRLSWKKLNSSG